METKQTNKSNIIAWVTWVFNLVVWIAQNWDDIPKPPSRTNTVKPVDDSDSKPRIE